MYGKLFAGTYAGNYVGPYADNYVGSYVDNYAGKKKRTVKEKSKGKDECQVPFSQSVKNEREGRGISSLRDNNWEEEDDQKGRKKRKRLEKKE